MTRIMPLLRDKNLNIAMLISASCHLLCIFSVTPVLDSGIDRKNHSVISFLGSILENVNVISEEDTLEPRKISHEYTTRRMEKYTEDVIFNPDSPEATSKLLSIKADKEKAMFLESKKDISVSNALYGRKKSLQIEFKDFNITGDARHRTILYRPPLPVLYVFNSYFSSDYTVIVRFRVSGHGFVDQPECVLSSGSSEVDSIAIRYMRRWQFIPSHERGVNLSKEDIGVIRFSFDAS